MPLLFINTVALAGPLHFAGLPAELVLSQVSDASRQVRRT